MRVLCWIGMHKWVNIMRKLTYWDERHDVYTRTDQCSRCKKRREWMDNGE